MLIAHSRVRGLSIVFHAKYVSGYWGSDYRCIRNLVSKYAGRFLAFSALYWLRSNIQAVRQDDADR